MAAASLTWLGHASFRLDSPGGKRIYVDPWLDNPKCPPDEKDPERCDVIAVTHGHSDHVASVVAITEKLGSVPIVAMIELKDWLTAQGARTDDLPGSNKGGTVAVGEIKFTLTHAFHSSSADDGTYTGEAAGIVVELEDGKKVYFAGDTCVFGDMQLIGRIYSPDVAVLPIGGHFTMDPREAAVACELLAVKRVVPCHYGTFPLVSGTPDELRQLATGVEVHAIDPGESLEL
jgi:L-ascorbate metabolism protein UlaG (beta-lactamase superfamily)